MEQRLVVGFDGSVESVAAVEWAAREAEVRDAIVDVVCVSAAADDGLLRSALEARVEAAVATVSTSHPSVKVEGEVVTGHAVDVLVDRSLEADLVVVGRHGVGTSERWTLGSTASAIGHGSASPVAYVHDLRRSAEVGRVIVGVDGSEAALHALDWAIDEAERREAELVVIHAWWYSFGSSPETTVARDLTRVDAELVLDGAIEHARARTACAVRGVLVEDDPAHAIVTHSPDADIVVVGSRGRGSVATMLFGSVAHGVSARSAAPTVVVRAPHSNA